MGSKNLKKEKRNTVLYGAVLCPACGYIQGTELTDDVFKNKSSFILINCYRCKEKVILPQNVLYYSDSSRITSAWIMNYKNKIMKGE